MSNVVALPDAPSTRVRWRHRYRDRLRITDAAVVTAATLAAVAVRLAVVGESTIATEPAWQRIGVPILIAGTWLLFLAAFRTRAPHVTGSGVTEYKRVLNASAAAFGILAMVILVLDVTSARWYFLVALPIGAITLLGGRWLWRRWLLAQRRYGHYLSRAIVVGTMGDIEYVVRQVDRNGAAGLHVVGIVTDDEPSAAVAIGDRTIPVLGRIEGAAAAAAASRADAVVVTGHIDADGTRLRRLGWDLEGTGAELVLSSSLADVAGPRIHFRPVEGLPLLHVEIPTFDGWRHVVKRAFDVLFALVALVLISPVLLVVAVTVKLDSPGPVFFRQTRCGRDGRTFEMLKFRSMVQTAEEDLAGLVDQNQGAGLLFKLRDDPRVTRVGRVLRAYSLDELPQFWNILVGDMSVVGPRPPLVSEVESYDGVVSRRLMIKPGLTGLWQISGRSDLSWEESVRLDLYYVENWSIAGDLMIIWRTVRAVVRPNGAY
ncbi:sugar transferase [Agromyces sp. MMS24-K17]|uniref:sugar transferase n=1 Tax=Agromyces sp. MMS24-K17 TaxID=3372850 RepID=UPI003754E545